MDPQCGDGGRDQDNLHCLALQHVTVNKRHFILKKLFSLLLFLNLQTRSEQKSSFWNFCLDFSFLVLEMDDGPPLGVVEGGGPVEHPQEEGGGEEDGQHLQAQSPPKPSK